MQALTDISGPITVNSTDQSAIYSLTVPQGSVLIMQQLSIFGDSNFLTNGRIQTDVSGDQQSVQGVSGEVQISNSFDLNYPPVSANPLLWKACKSGTKVQVRARAVASSGIANVLLMGFLIDPKIYDALIAAELKKLGL